MSLFLYVCTLRTWVEVREISAEVLGIELRSQVWQHAPLLTEPFHYLQVPQFLPVEWRQETPSTVGLLGKQSELEPLAENSRYGRCCLH